MSEWWTYELSDFLLFSHRVYLRLFELHNAAVWPAQIGTLLVGAAIVFGLLHPGRRSIRLIPLGLGVLWIWIAWSFFWERYATINWAAPYVAPLFALEGIMLAALASVRGINPPTSNERTAHFYAAMILFSLFLVVYPAVAPALGRPVAAAEFFGIAPDPTAVATLAILAVSRSKGRWLLMIVPVLWSIISGLTLWTMGADEALLAPICALIACTIAVSNRRAA